MKYIIYNLTDKTILRFISGQFLLFETAEEAQAQCVKLKETFPDHEYEVRLKK